MHIQTLHKLNPYTPGNIYIFRALDASVNQITIQDVWHMSKQRLDGCCKLKEDLVYMNE